MKKVINLSEELSNEIEQIRKEIELIREGKDAKTKIPDELKQNILRLVKVSGLRLYAFAPLINVHCNTIGKWRSQIYQKTRREEKKKELVEQLPKLKPVDKLPSPRKPLIEIELGEGKTLRIFA